MIPRYQSTLMKELWSEEKKFSVWFLVERVYLLALLKSQGQADEGLHARLEQAAAKINWTAFAQKVALYEQETKHDVIAFLHALMEELHGDARLIHYGLTSSDIVDTSFAYLLRAANDQILAQLKLVIKALWHQARRYRGVPCLGRTHGQAAEETTLGIKLLGHVCEFARGYDRLFAAAKDLAVGKLSGATGIYTFTAPAVEALVLKELGLTHELVATQIVARDRHAHYFATLAVLAGSIERFATEIRLLQHGQTQEVFEPFSAQQKGSSAMPHKRNPILCENLSGLMRMMRSYAVAALENQALWHERDISHSSVERIIAPDATSIIDFALTRLDYLVTNMVVDEKRMQRNLLLGGEELASQALMKALLDQGMMRVEAYEMVQAAALQNPQESFLERLRLVGITKILGEAPCANILCQRTLPLHEPDLYDRVEEVIAPLFTP